MNKEQTIWKRLSGKSGDLILTRRSGTLRRSEVVAGYIISRQEDVLTQRAIDLGYQHIRKSKK